MEELWLARHGETEWSRDKRHTGKTDVPLTDLGMQQAGALGRRLRGITFDLVLSSPMTRALDTARAAGFANAETTEDLAEFDYGAYEGKTSAEIKNDRPDWNLWRDGCPGGETPDLVAVRVDRVLARAETVPGRVLVVGHGHCSRILAARFLGLPGAGGGLFALDVATVSTLGYEHGRPVITLWNEAPGKRG